MNSCSDALFVGVENGNNRPFYTLPDLIYGYNFQRSGKQTCSDKTDLIDSTGEFNDSFHRLLPQLPLSSLSNIKFRNF